MKKIIIIAFLLVFPILVFALEKNISLQFEYAPINTLDFGSSLILNNGYMSNFSVEFPFYKFTITTKLSFSNYDYFSFNNFGYSSARINNINSSFAIKYQIPIN